MRALHALPMQGRTFEAAPQNEHSAEKRAFSGTARLAQSAERKALNLVVVGSSPTVGVLSAGQWAQVCKVHSETCYQGIKVLKVLK